ncbi:MAG: type II toxin-antitoxin system Phd/YefM family antitoxin [Spirochaetota bacterium]
MKILQLNEVKTNLSAILKEVGTGKEIGISYGKKKETIAVIVPIKNYNKLKKRVLGTLKGKMSVEFKPGYRMSDKELLRS